MNALEIAVLHNSLNPTGGAEKLCVTVIEALRDVGHDVTLVTFEPTDWRKVTQNFGEATRPTHEHTVFPLFLPFLSIYQRLVGLAFIERQLRRFDYSINTHGDMVPIPCDLTYMHFPTYLMQEEINSPANAKYQHSLFWKCYFKPYDIIKRRLIHRYARHGHIVTNSQYSRDIIKHLVGITPDVLYPPVDTSVFQKVSSTPLRRRLVVTCSRISPEKNLEQVPQLAQQLPDIDFALIGSTSYISGSTLKAIHREAQGLDNFQLHTDFSLSKLLQLYGEASLYFHPMMGEHFGISVVEAMASGLIPLVHRSGGPWKDILKEGRYGYGFTDVVDACQLIPQLLDGDANRHLFRTRAQRFDREQFKTAIQDMIA